MKLILKAIMFDVDFRKNELTNWLEMQKEHPLVLGKDQTVCFVSSSMRQIVFILACKVVQTKKLDEVPLIESLRLRLGAGQWDPYMLQNYANELGIELVGIKRFEQILQERNLQKRLVNNDESA